MRLKKSLLTMIFAAVLSLTATALSAAAAAPETSSKNQFKVQELKAAEKYSQLIIVSGYNKNYARVTMYTKKGDKWKREYTVKGRVGEKGIGKARSNVSISPRGIYKLYTAFGIKPDPGSTRPYTQVNYLHYWSADTNRLQVGYARGEHLLSAGKAYNYAIGIGYNLKARKGKGSAFFLHCFGKRGIKSPTAGCVSIPQKYMKKTLRKLHKDTRIIIDYSYNIEKY